MRAPVPKRARTSSRAASRAVPPALVRRSKGRISWMASASSRLATAMPTSVRPWARISGAASARRRPGHFEDGVGAVGRPGQRVGPGDPGEVVEAEAQHDGAADPVGGPQPAGDPVDEADERRRRRRRGRAPGGPGAAEGVLRPDRPPPPAGLHRAGIPVVGQGVEVAARRLPQHRHEHRFGQARRPPPPWRSPGPAACRR